MGEGEETGFVNRETRNDNSQLEFSVLLASIVIITIVKKFLGLAAHRDNRSIS